MQSVRLSFVSGLAKDLRIRLTFGCDRPAGNQGEGGRTAPVHTCENSAQRAKTASNNERAITLASLTGTALPN